MVTASKLQTAKILLVEDEPDMVQLVRDWLLRQNYEVDVIADGNEALSYLNVNKHKHEIIILDIMLPNVVVV